MKNIFFKSALLVSMSVSTPIYAKDIFVADIQVDNSERQQLGFDNIINFANQYTDRQLSMIFPNYNSKSQVEGISNLRGVPINMSFAANSGVMRLEIPSLNIVREYGELNANRSVARTEFVNAIKGKDKELMEALTKEWVKKSPVDSVAGNPTSLLSTMVSTSMDVMSNMGHTGTNSNHKTLSGSGQASNSTFAVMPRFGRYSLDGYGSDVYTIPFAYNTVLGADQKTELSIDAPITVVEAEGALSIGGSLGLGLNYQVYTSAAYDWYLMPNIRFGATGSEDLGTVAMIYGGGISSKFFSPINEKSSIAILNLISYLKTDSLEIENVDNHYNLSNTILRNGFEYSYALDKTVAGSPLVTKYQFARTDYLGDDLYADVTNELSASIGFANNKKNSWIKEFRAGFTYTYINSDAHGISFNAGYTF